MAHQTNHHRKKNPPVINARLQDGEDFPHIQITIKVPEYTDTEKQRDKYLQRFPDYFRESIQNKKFNYIFVFIFAKIGFYQNILDKTCSFL